MTARRRGDGAQELSRRRALQTGLAAAAVGVAGRAREALAGFGSGGRATDAPQSLDPLVVDPQHYQLEFENEFVKVIRCRIPPHDKVAMHHHPVGSVIIFVTDQNLRQTLSDGTRQEAHHKAGEVLWAEPSTHMGENYTDQPYEYIRVDIKAAAR
jgi:quercetin dioxygenase-like cupin family protein